MKRLTKADIRHIQSQESFLLRTSTLKLEKKSLTLYIKNPTAFYIVNLKDEMKIDTSDCELLFKDKTGSLLCTVNAEVIEKGSEEFEDALDFFSINSKKVEQVLECKVVEIINKG